MALIHDDLPTLDRPTMTISGLKGSAGGHCSSDGDEVMNVACWTVKGKSISFQLTTGVAFVLDFAFFSGALCGADAFLSGFLVANFFLAIGWVVGGVVIIKTNYPYCLI
jgi:hypothetical protein